MSQYHLVSSGAVIGKVFTDFRPTNNGWEVDAIEWIADALGLMLIAPAFTLTNCKAEVKGFRCKIPCPVEYFGAIEYNGNIITGMNPTGLANNIASGLLTTKARCGQHSYSLNPNYIHTTFECGEILIHYYGYCLDEYGYPMIPDDSVVKEALSWYIMFKYLLRGGSHPTITWQDAEARWIKYKGQAENRVKRMTPTKYDTFVDNWVSLVPTMRRQYDYYTNTNRLIINNNPSLNNEPTLNPDYNPNIH